MSFPILNDYQSRFPECAALLKSLPSFYHKKLWNELTIACLEFVYHPTVKGKVTFAFYTDFVKRFQKNIDQINLLKIIRESVASLSNTEVLEFLSAYEEKEASNDEIKILIVAFRGYYSISTNIEVASQLLNLVKTYIDSHKDVDSYVYSSYYKLAFTFYASKLKYKQFYNSSLQYLAYTQAQQIEQGEKLKLLFQMAIAVLVSDEIYNFSQLLEQPLLVSLKTSLFSWMYELIQIFNRGDIVRFNETALQHDELVRNKTKLQQKIRLMAFLELAFNLPKNNRVIGFDALSKATSIPVEHVEFMVMKAMALKLICGSIDQIKRQVTISWVAPKVLETDRITTMLGKFSQWQQGVKKVQSLIRTIKV